MAFFNCPGTEALYSGVANSSASASAIAARRTATAWGAGSTSSSSEYGGTAMSASCTTTRAAAGASPPAARRSAVLSEPARRLPEIARTRIVSVGDEFEVDRQGDLPREHVAASRQLCLEVEAPVAAVDDGDEIEGCAPAAVEIVDRGDERAGGGDRPVETAHRRSEERRVGKECRARWAP